MAKLIVLDKFKDKVKLPKRATKGAAAYDLEAAEDIIIPSLFSVIFNSIENQEDLKQTKSLKDVVAWVKQHKLMTLVSTGLTLECAEDEHLNIQPRSGLANKACMIIPNSPGLVDSDYNGYEIKVGLLNLSPFNIKIKKGERIAQAMFVKHIFCDDEDEVLTERSGGFGSTGV